MIRRLMGPNWHRFGWIALAAFCLELCLLLFSSRAWADINVAYISVERQQSYESMRVYAGRTLPARAAQLGFKRGGEIRAMQVDLGDNVSEGQELARLDTQAIHSKLSQTTADISLAKANLAALEAETQLAINTEKRFRKLRQQGHASQQIYDEANLSLRAKKAQSNVARANLERANAAHRTVRVELSEAVIKAPFAGIIQARHVDEGTQINAGQPALRLVELGNNEAHIGVPAAVGTRLIPGNDYSVRWNNQQFRAALSAVLPEVDPATRTLTAVFKLNNNSVPLGSVVELAVEEQVNNPGFWLPLSALTAADRGLWGVYVIDKNNVIERRLIEIIHSEADRVFARGTLSTDDKVVQTGVQRIVPGQKVNATPVAEVSYAR